MLPERIMTDPPELRRWIARAFNAAAFELETSFSRHIGRNGFVMLQKQERAHEGPSFMAIQ